MNPRVAIVGGVVAALLGTLFTPVRGLAQGSGHPRPDPVGLSQVPVSGWPVYVEDLTIGSPVSDYGSHFGIKASTLDDGAPESDLFADARSLLYHATYAANTDDGRQMDEGFFRFFDGNGASRFAPAESREIHFHPWGWEETAVDGDLTAEGYAMTFEEDVFLVATIVTNDGDESVTLTPRFNVRNETDPETESSFPASQRDDFAVAEMIEPGVAGVTYAAPFVFGLFGFNVFERAIVADPEVHDVANIGSLRYYRKRVNLAPFTLGPGERRGVYVLVAFDDYATPAADRAVAAQEALAAMGADAAEAIDAAVAETDAEWDDFFASLPPPHGDEPNDARIYDLAATALRMNVYGQRGLMPGRASVPGKVHFNLFFVWDLPLQALGHNEWDPTLATEELGVQYGFCSP
ncbi:MAG: hypothetical protein KC466_12320, partial [Myxococcales bacterium]|nr:hypothetical protein [Myxococcales bacterium]